MKTHIPDGTGKTYCGRPVFWAYDGRGRGAVCIDIKRDCVETATCRARQRSDDRRVNEAYYREQMALPPEKRDNNQ